MQVRIVDATGAIGVKMNDQQISNLIQRTAYQICDENYEVYLVYFSAK